MVTYTKHLIFLVMCILFISNQAHYNDSFVRKSCQKNRVSYSYQDKEIEVVIGDITQLKNVDAIVNAAHPSLFWGGGVCNAIFEAAGKNLLEDIVNDLLEQEGIEEIEVGDARITPIPVSTKALSTVNNTDQNILYVVHAVGPDCNDEEQNNNREELLGLAYKRSIDLADAHDIHSIAFPAISASTAIFAYHPLEAASVAIAASLEQFQKTNVKKLMFVFLDKKDGSFDFYASILDRMLKPGLFNFILKSI